MPCQEELLSNKDQQGKYLKKKVSGMSVSKTLVSLSSVEQDKTIIGKKLDNARATKVT